jgi:hypothetical protein
LAGATVAEYIDPEELPFSVAEVARAGSLFLAPDDAVAMATHLADCSESVIKLREAKRERWRAQGHPNPTSADAGWSYPEELLAALAALSIDCERRARGVLEHEWKARRDATVQEAALRAAEHAGLVPTRKEIEARIAAEYPTGRVPVTGYSLPSIPAPTAAMREAGDAYRRQLVAEWEREVARFREELQSREGA